MFSFFFKCYIMKMVNSMDYEFKTLKELYNRIKPALTSKCTEFKVLGFNNIKEKDIWDYLTGKKWTSSHNLDLSTMVSDIFDLRIEEINNYLIGNR